MSHIRLKNNNAGEIWLIKKGKKVNWDNIFLNKLGLSCVENIVFNADGTITKSANSGSSTRGWDYHILSISNSELFSKYKLYGKGRCVINATGLWQWDGGITSFGIRRTATSGVSRITKMDSDYTTNGFEIIPNNPYVNSIFGCHYWSDSSAVQYFNCKLYDLSLYLIKKK